MRVQLGNIFYTGSYAVLRNTKSGSSFPYSAKVEGLGRFGTGKSLFGFATVTITEHMVTAKYGTKITNGPRVQMKTAGSKNPEDFVKVSKEKLDAVKLPKSFEKLKETSSFYYHGEAVLDYELIRTAVALGKMELPPEDAKNGSMYAWEAFEVLVKDEAATKYGWSDTLYSEDGKYTFTKDVNGKYKMHLIDDIGMGASVEDIANWMMSGTPNRNIETRYLNYFRSVAPDLYEKAMQIGTEVRNYGFMEDLYGQGILSKTQNLYDLSLLGLLFGKDAEEMRSLLNKCRETGNHLELLELYNNDGAVSLQRLREKQMKYGGIV